MKLTNTYKSLILELQGISSQGRAWSNILNELIKENKTGFLTVQGKNYPEAYKTFPVDIFYITITNDMGNGYDEQKSGYDENKNYCVYLLIERSFHGSLSPIADSMIGLNHELRHAFEDYSRISKNKPRIIDTKEIKTFYNSDFAKLLSRQIPGYFEPFTKILRALYFTSKLEESGWSETVYDSETHPISMDIIDHIKSIMKRNYLQNMPKDKELKKTWNDLKSKVNIPIVNKYDDYVDFIEHADKIIQSRAKKVYRKLSKVKYFAKVNSTKKEE